MDNSLYYNNSETNNISDRRVENTKLFKKKLNYYTVQNSLFSKSTFKNCDISGCKFYNSNFYDIQLNNADIISLIMSNCCFENVCFDGTCIDDIDFQNCIFKDCSFNNFTMKNCRFVECKFFAFRPSCCLCELNNYIDCSFSDSVFSSSFHYQIFSNCKFINTSTKIELVGYNYGLLSSGNITIEDHNEPDSLVSTNKPDCLYNSFISQNLYVNALILKINYEYNENPTIIMLWADFLEIMISNNIIIKSNELLFIKNLITYFSENKIIAPILLYALNGKLVRIINRYPIHSQKTKDDLVLLINNLYFEFRKRVQTILDTTIEPDSTNHNVVIEINYIEKPQIDLCQILNQFGVGECRQIKTAKGSFIEWISCPNNIISCLEIFLMLLDITVPIIYDSFKRKKGKKNSKNSNPLGVLNLSENDMKNMKINITINNGCHILYDSNFVENNFYGYNNKNVLKINISDEK